MSLVSRYPEPRRPGRLRGAGWLGHNARLVYGLIGVVGFLALWEIGSRQGWISATF